MKMAAGEANDVASGSGGVPGAFSLLLMIGFSSGPETGGPRPGAARRLREIPGQAADDAIVSLPSQVIISRA
jgi:hypothetical protein